MTEHLLASSDAVELDLDLAIERQRAQIERELGAARWRRILLRGSAVVEQQSHNLQVAGSIPAPATNYAASEAEPGVSPPSPGEAEGAAVCFELVVGVPVSVRQVPNPNATPEAYALAHPHPKGRW